MIPMPSSLARLLTAISDRSAGRRIARPARLSAGSALAALAAAVVAVGTVSVAPPLQAQEAKPETPTWQNVLALQLRDEYRCDMDKVLFDRDVDVGGRTSKEGRARCLDGREFDFSRPSTHEKFDIRLCMPTVC